MKENLLSAIKKWKLGRIRCIAFALPEQEKAQIKKTNPAQRLGEYIREKSILATKSSISSPIWWCVYVIV